MPMGEDDEQSIRVRHSRRRMRRKIENARRSSASIPAKEVFDGSNAARRADESQECPSPSSMTAPSSGSPGRTRTTLLQNVVTLDMDDVDRHGSGYGALLTPQGKILWDFVLHKLPDGYAADVRAGEAEAFAKRLSLYRLRAKVEIAVGARARGLCRMGIERRPRPQPLPTRGRGGAQRSAPRGARHAVGLRRRARSRPTPPLPTGIAIASRSPFPKAGSTSSSATRFRTMRRWIRCTASPSTRAATSARRW